MRAKMVPEWAKQEAVMLAWPHADTDWRPWLEAVEQDYVELAAAIAAEATPLILCRDADQQVRIREWLDGRCRYEPRVMMVPYNDTWCRDYGPLTLAAGGKMELVEFQFRGWGDKYDAVLDNNVNRSISAVWIAPLRSVDYELEGGSIDTDGQDTLLTTTACLLESNRNPGCTRDQVEEILRRELGMDRMLWISAGMLAGDDTDGHIDNLVRFCDANTIAYTACTRTDDVHFEPLRAMAEQVQALRRTDGQPYILHPIELPQPLFDEDGKRLPGSYINFLILNDSVLVPVFGCPQDDLALDGLQRCFPGKRLVPVPGRNLVRQYGGPHCATMQLPVGTCKPGTDK